MNIESEKCCLDFVIIYMSDGIFVIDCCGCVCIVNDMVLKMFGFVKEDVIGYYMFGVFNLENEFLLEEI